MKRIILSIFICVTLVVIGGAGLFTYVRYWSQLAVTLPEPIIITYAKGTPLKSYASQLSESHVIDQPLFFSLWVRWQGSYPKFKAGTYRFEKNISPQAIIDTTINGQTFSVTFMTIPIPEGFTLNQIVDRLAAREIGSKTDIPIFLQ